MALLEAARHTAPSFPSFRLMLHRLHLPARPVADFVEHLWLVRGEVPGTQRQMLLPDGGLVLIFNLGEPQRLCERADTRQHTVFRASWVSGQQPQPIVIQQGGRYHLLGIRFRPGGAFPLFRFPVAELTGRVVEFSDVWGTEASHVREQLDEARTDDDRFRRLEDWLAQRLRQATPDPRIRFAAKALQQGDIGVGRLAEQTGISGKHLTQHFERHVGLTPKLYGRVQRLQRTIAHIGTRSAVDWAETAFAGGFYDQAHLIRDFRELVGLTPTEYLARRSPYPGYLNVA